MDETDPTLPAVDPNRRLLGGRYEIGEVLGYGGMAEVFRGRDTRLSRDVAVKVLRTDLARDPSFQMRFRREAQAAASLNHSAIVAVYDTGEQSTIPYIVMEYVEGHTLREVLQHGRLTVQRSLEITADVCAALESSHRSGIIHRDIKPGNVMLTREGVVKVMDFGIARAITGSAATMTQTASVIGTAQYLSPEQARGETVDARSDVYSTGVLLYELLTGLPPFRGDSPVAVTYQHVREDPQPPSRLDPDIPPDVDAIVLKALAKNPGNRYQGAGEFREDLTRAAMGQPVMATPLLPYEAATDVTPTTSAYPAGGYPSGRTARNPPGATSCGSSSSWCSRWLPRARSRSSGWTRERRWRSPTWSGGAGWRARSTRPRPTGAEEMTPERSGCDPSPFAGLSRIGQFGAAARNVSARSRTGGACPPS